MKRQIVCLEVTFNDKAYDAPATWNWATLAETPVKVLATGRIEPAPVTSRNGSDR